MSTSTNRSSRTLPPAQDLPAERRAVRRLLRAGVVGATVGAALVSWVMLVPVGGIELAAEQDAAVTRVGPVAIAFAAGSMAPAGWALLAILERRTARALRIWTVIAVIACALSLGSPLVSGIGAGAKLGLASLHLVVGAVTILGLRRTRIDQGA